LKIIVRKLLYEVEIKLACPRHTFASHLAMNGVGLKAIHELLSHADMKITMRYAHLSPGHLQAAVSVLNALGKGSAEKIDSKLTFEAQKSKRVDNLSIVTP